MPYEDELDLDLRMANRHARVQFFVSRALRRQQLPRPVHQLQARGIYVPTPSPQSRAAVVKLWPAQSSTTAAHSRYLIRGKGYDGDDAMLFTSPGQDADRLAFASRAQEDPHQFRFIVSLVPPIPHSWEAFTQRVMAVVSRDLHTALDWLAAVHHDTRYEHVHVQLRGRTDDGQPLYLMKDYYRHGIRHRAQQIATEFLGRLSPRQVAREHQLLPEVSRDVTEPRRPRTLTREEVTERLAMTQAQIDRFRSHVRQVGQRAAARRGLDQGAQE